MERMFCLMMGYAFGLFQTGYLYSRSKKMDIRNYGSGNSGSTNILRVMGVKAGLIVFLGDAGKMVLACLITWLLFSSRPDMVRLYMMYTAAGVVLGHSYPFYMGFRGGKGIASCAGLLAVMDYRVMLLCFIIFVITVAFTRYVSLGSILVMLVMASGFVYFAWQGSYWLASGYLMEFSALTSLIAVFCIWRHRENIKRLLSGEENKIGAKKKGAQT